MPTYWSLIKLLFAFSILNLTSLGIAQANTALSLPLDPTQNPGFGVDKYPGGQIQSLNAGKVILTLLAYINLQWQKDQPRELDPAGETSQDSQLSPFTKLFLKIFVNPAPVSIPRNTQNAAWAAGATISWMLTRQDLFPDGQAEWYLFEIAWKIRDQDFGVFEFELLDGEPVDPQVARVFVTHQYGGDNIPRGRVLRLINDASKLTWSHPHNQRVSEVYSVGQQLEVGSGPVLTLQFLAEGSAENPVTFGYLAEGLRFMLVQYIKDKPAGDWISDDVFFFIAGTQNPVARVSLRLTAGAVGEVKAPDTPPGFDNGLAEAGEIVLKPDDPNWKGSKENPLKAGSKDVPATGADGDGTATPISTAKRSRRWRA